MTSVPLVTIVIPVYNGGSYLRPAIESALAQTWPATEVIVVDDGSTDGGATRQVAESFGERVRYVHKPNGGVGSALNRGVEEMRGEYFSWLSHDDLYDVRKVELQMRVVQRHDRPVIVFSDYELMDAEAKFLGRVEVGPRFDPEKPLWAVLEGLINGCALLIPRLCFEECGLFEAGRFHSQDYELWYRLAQRYRFVHSPGSLVRYRVHANQDSHSPRHIEEANLLWIEMLEGLSPSTMQGYEGSELAFLIRAGDFVKRTGYDGAKTALPRMIAKAAQDHPLGVVLLVRSRREALSAIAFLQETDLPLRFMIMDAAPDPLQSLAVSAPDLIEAHPYHRALAGTPLRDMAEAAAAQLGTELIAFVSYEDSPRAGWFRDAYERLVRYKDLDGLLVDKDFNPGPVSFGVLGGGVLRRTVLQSALDRSSHPGSSFEQALGISARLSVEAASGVRPAESIGS